MKYGYGRVSAKDQNLARQLAALKAYAPDLDDDHMMSGVHQLVAARENILPTWVMVSLIA